MHGLYFLYITHQAEGLSVHGPYEKRDEAESCLLCDMTEALGWSVDGDEEVHDILNDAYSKRGLELSANKEGTDDIILYLRELEVADESV